MRSLAEPCFETATGWKRVQRFAICLPHSCQSLPRTVGQLGDDLLYKVGTRSGLFADIRIFRVFSNRLPELTFAVTALWHPDKVGVSIGQRTQRAYADHADAEISVILGSLNVGFFSHFQGVVYLNSKVAHRRLQLGVAK